MKKLKAHLWTLPRWFAAPFFGASILLGSVLAGGINANAWLALIAGLLVMAGGHSFNSFLDYAWTGLDKGEIEDRSAEKDYTGGQNIIEAGIVTVREVAINAIIWYLLSAIPIIYLAFAVGWPIIVVWVVGMLVTFWYSWGKLNWTQETALAVGVGPGSVLLGMFAVSPNPPWGIGLLASVPIAIILSYLGLALDEWPDAEANLKKGVKSVAYIVWKYGVSLEWYASTWLMFLLIYQLFLIQLGIFSPATALAFIPAAVVIPLLVMMKGNFRKTMGAIVLVAAFYPILLLVGQIIGG